MSQATKVHGYDSGNGVWKGLAVDATGNLQTDLVASSKKHNEAIGTLNDQHGSLLAAHYNSDLNTDKVDADGDAVLLSAADDGTLIVRPRVGNNPTLSDGVTDANISTVIGDDGEHTFQPSIGFAFNGANYDRLRCDSTDQRLQINGHSPPATASTLTALFDKAVADNGLGVSTGDTSTIVDIDKSRNVMIFVDSDAACEIAVNYSPDGSTMFEDSVSYTIGITKRAINLGNIPATDIQLRIVDDLGNAPNISAGLVVSS